MSELFSKMLVICAKNNFETITPKKMTGNQKRTFFSPEHKMAYSSHEKICQAWRKEGRPTDINHPARIAKLNSQRNLQRIPLQENKIMMT